MKQPYQTHRNKIGHVMLLVAMGGLLTPLQAQTPPNTDPSVTDTNHPPRKHHRPPPPGHGGQDAAGGSGNAVGAGSAGNGGCERGLNPNQGGGDANGAGHRPPHTGGKPVPGSANTNAPANSYGK